MLSNELEWELIVGFLKKSQTLQLRVKRVWEEKRNAQENNRRILCWNSNISHGFWLFLKMVMFKCTVQQAQLPHSVWSTVFSSFWQCVVLPLQIPALQDDPLFPCFILRNKTQKIISFRKLFYHADFEANQKTQTHSNLILKTSDNLPCKYVGEKWTFLIHENIRKGGLKLERPWPAPDVSMSRFQTVL